MSLLNIDWITNPIGYNVQNILPISYSASCGPIALPSNTEVTLTNWTTLTGTLPGFNTTTGLFTCQQSGLYLYNINFRLTGVGVNTDILIQVKDSLNNIVFASTQRITADASLSYGFIGNGQLMTSSPASTIKFTLRQDTNGVSMQSCTLKIVKIFGF